MPITSELIAWLDLHENDVLVDRSNGFISREEVLRLAETSAEVELEAIADSTVTLLWERGAANAPHPRHNYVSISFAPRSNPSIQLAETPLTFERYSEKTPEKLELCSGFLGSSRADALALLDLSLETFGLLAVVTRAPRELWDAALDQVYGVSEASPNE